MGDLSLFSQTERANSLPGSDTQTHPHESDRKREEKWWQKATAEGAGGNSILNMPGEAVQVNCLAYVMYKWMAICWEKERIIINIYALCTWIKKNKSAFRKLVHCPTKRQGTWQAPPLILSLFRWLLPSFSSCSWFLLFLGSVHQEAFNCLKMDGKTAGKSLVSSCKPSLAVTLLQKHERHSCAFAEHGHTPHYNSKKRSAPPSVNKGVSGHNGCWESWWCSNLSYCA